MAAAHETSFAQSGLKDLVVGVAPTSFPKYLNAVFRSLTNIYKSMGGGWNEKAEAGLSSQPAMKAGFFALTVMPNRIILQ